jgi:hypothetical protein
MSFGRTGVEVTCVSFIGLCNAQIHVEFELCVAKFVLVVFSVLPTCVCAEVI